jgi:SUF system FeS cluster assembly, SufBD
MIISTNSFLPGSSFTVKAGDFLILEDEEGKIGNLEISPGAKVSHKRRVGSQLIVTCAGEYSLDLKLEATGTNSIEIFCIGDSAVVSISELLLATTRGAVITSTVSISVNAPNCRVSHRCKALAIDAVIDWAGTVVISEGAAQAEAVQVARGLPLREGRIFFKPLLDIKNDKVKVKHGIAVLKELCARQKMFLLNRGVSEKQADELLLAGFISG